jgi:hypothetical protein
LLFEGGTKNGSFCFFSKIGEAAKKNNKYFNFD